MAVVQPSQPSSGQHLPLGVAHHPWAATVVTSCAAALLAPEAAWQFGPTGASVVAVLALAVVASEWLSAWFAEQLSRTSRMAAILLTASGLRMALPLITVLVIVVRFRESVPVRSVLYVVPLYMAMLFADIVCRRRGSTVACEE